MVITFAAILIGLLFLIRPLRKNTFYILHCTLVILAGYYLEKHYGLHYRIFGQQALMMLAVLHLVSINLVVILAYGRDKSAAVHGAWRVPEVQLHTLELLGGWCGAWLAQKIFHHKTKKRSFQAMFWLMLIFQVIIVLIFLRQLRLI